METAPNRIREIREELAARVPRVFSQRELARRLGINPETLRSWELGRHRPPKRSAARLARALGVTVAELGLDQVAGAPTPQTSTSPRAAAKGPGATVALAIVTRDNTVLLTCRRRKEPGLAWGFPSGAVEEGETPHQAAEREVEEELSFVAIPVRTIGERIHPSTQRHMVYVECHAGPGEPTLVDHEELEAFEWVTLERLAELVPNGIFGPVQQYLDRTIGAKIHA